MGRTKKGGYKKPKNKKLVNNSLTRFNTLVEDVGKREIKFYNFYKTPYKNIDGIVFSSNNNWAWTFKGYLNDKDYQDAVMMMISDEIPGRINKEQLIHEEGEIFFTKTTESGELRKEMIMQIRGWGALTGGDLGLDNETAAKIQDDFCDWIISKISK